MEVNGAPELLCFPHSSEYLPCVQQNKHIHTGSELLEGEIHFWVNYPFNISTRVLKHILLAGDIDFFHRLECFFHLT